MLHVHHILTPSIQISPAGSTPSKVAMARVQAVMGSGRHRHRTELLCSQWSSNKRGICRLSDACSEMLEDIPHIVQVCSALTPTREKLMKYTQEYASAIPHELRALLMHLCSPSYERFCSFLLDCSTLPEAEF